MGASDHFERGNPPDRVYRGFVRRVKPGLDVFGCIVSQCFWNTWVHWHGRTTPCYRDRAACPGCKIGHYRKYLGYLFFRNESNQKYEHIELPLDAAHDLSDMIGHDGELRGTRFHAKRVGGKKGRILWDLKSRLELIAPDFVLPPDEGPHKILEYLWQINAQKLRLAEQDDLPERDAI